MKLTNYPNCRQCGKLNIAGKLNLCLACYCKTNQARRIAELKEKVKIAEVWLLEPHEPEKFDEGLKRYETLVQELDLLQAI